MIKQNNQNVKKGMFPYFLLLVIALSIMFFYSMTSGTNKELSYNKRGNIYAATPCAMIGYYKNEEENKKHFYVDKNGIKWSKTGDIGYLNNNGELFVSGRASDYSIINNKKIFNFDVENIILSFNQIKNCDVFEYFQIAI